MGRWSTTESNLPKLRLEALKPSERTRLEPWQAIGLILRHLYGLSYKEACTRIHNGRGMSTLAECTRSPAGKELLTWLRDNYSTPEALARMIIQSGAVDFTADYLTALEWAKTAQDYMAVYKMTKDFLAISGVKEEPKPQTPIIHLHLGEKSLEAIPVETSYESVELEPELSPPALPP